MRGLAAVLAAFVLGFAPGPSAGAPAPVPRVAQVWSRPALAGDTGVLYATLSGGATGDRLIAVETPVAASAELHESKPVATIFSLPRHVSGASPTPMAGMEMQPVAGVAVAANRHALLSPGGYHVMLVGLHRALVAGESFPVTFVFERAGRIAARATVRPL